MDVTDVSHSKRDFIPLIILRTVQPSIAPCFFAMIPIIRHNERLCITRDVLVLSMFMAAGLHDTPIAVGMTTTPYGTPIIWNNRTAFAHYAADFAAIDTVQLAKKKKIRASFSRMLAHNNGETLHLGQIRMRHTDPDLVRRVIEQNRYMGGLRDTILQQDWGLSEVQVDFYLLIQIHRFLTETYYKHPDRRDFVKVDITVRMPLADD